MHAHKYTHTHTKVVTHTHTHTHTHAHTNRPYVSLLIFLIFAGDYIRKELSYLTFAADGSVNGSYVFGSSGRLTSVELAPDGSIYTTSDRGGLARISYASGNSPPQLLDVTAEVPQPIMLPVKVQFTANAVDPEGDAIQYTWDFGDGSRKVAGAKTVHTYTQYGVYAVNVIVADAVHQVRSDDVAVVIGVPPTVAIASPANGSYFSANDMVMCTLDMSSPDLTVEWNIQLLHDDHTHPILLKVPTPTTSFVVAPSGHDFEGNTAIQIEVVVTDSTGLSASDMIIILPRKATVRFESQPPGLTVFVDGLPLVTPTEVVSLVGFLHSIRAPSRQCLPGASAGGSASGVVPVLEFSNWSDQGGIAHVLATPTAQYTTVVVEYVNSTFSRDTLASSRQNTTLPVTDGLVLYFSAESGLVTSAISAPGPVVAAASSSQSLSSPPPSPSPISSEAAAAAAAAAGGIPLGSSVVQNWTDLSGKGNDLIGLTSPRLVLADDTNDFDYVRLAGSGSKFRRDALLKGVPRGNKDRTLMFVGRYVGDGKGSAVFYGDNSLNCSTSFSMGVDENGFLFVQAACQIFVSPVLVIKGDWLVQTVIVKQGFFRHFKDGTLIDSGVITIQSENSYLSIGGTGSDSIGASSSAIDIVALVGFQRAIEGKELEAMEEYLQFRAGSLYCARAAVSTTTVAPVTVRLFVCEITFFFCVVQQRQNLKKGKRRWNEKKKLLKVCTEGGFKAEKSKVNVASK